MNTLKKFSFIPIILVTVFLLSACIPTGAADDGSTIDATQAAELVETAVAQALSNQATQIAESVPQATATIAATNTAIPAPATLTPPPTITPFVMEPTATFTSSSGGGSFTPEYRCKLISIEPAPNASSVFPSGGTFDVNITIQNTGTATWPAGFDLTYYSGPNMAPDFPSMLELPEVEPGDTYSFGPYDGTAPDKIGFYVMSFQLHGVPDCFPYFAIYVE